MTITVEDGTIVTGANSWVSRDDFIAYADARGVTIADEDASDALLIKACDYINSLEPRIQGALVERDQPTAFPRTDLFIEGWSWSSNEIPRQVISAQLALALEINAGADPFNPPDDLPVVEKRVEGAVTVKYANPSTVTKVSKNQASDTIIRTFLKRSGLFAVRA